MYCLVNWSLWEGASPIRSPGAIRSPVVSVPLYLHRHCGTFAIQNLLCFVFINDSIRPFSRSAPVPGGRAPGPGPKHSHVLRTRLELDIGSMDWVYHALGPDSWACVSSICHIQCHQLSSCLLQRSAHSFQFIGRHVDNNGQHEVLGQQPLGNLRPKI